MARINILKAVLTVVIAILASVVSYAEGLDAQLYNIGGMEYGLDFEEHIATLIKGTQRSGDLIIPSQITYANQTFTVTEIYTAAFFVPSNRGECKITSVTIPQSVRKIGNSAFYQCKYLRSVKILSNDYEIGDGAFARCFNLENVILSEGIKKIEPGTFDSCDKLKSLVIPRSIEQIREYAFGDRLEVIEILNPDTKIHEKAFIMCPNVKIIGWDGEFYKVEKKRIQWAYYMVNGKKLDISDRQLQFYFKSEEEAEQHRISEKYYYENPIH